MTKIILKKIQLAKIHGIYGFAIYFTYDFKKNNMNNITNYIIKIISEGKKIKFAFLLIWNNDNCDTLFNDIKDNINRLQIIEKKLEKFIIYIKNYLTSNNYIKIKNKPAISFSNPSIFQNLNKIILVLRAKAREQGIKDIFLFISLNNTFINLPNLSLFDAAYDISKKYSSEKDEKKINIFYYSGLIYKNILFNSSIYNFPIYRTSILEIYNNSLYRVFKDYTPEKYFILNKIIINWTKMNFNETSGFFFINSWNNYEEGAYLEPDEEYGYASINSFSRALFELPFKENKYNLLNLEENGKCIIAIQAHVYYEDLINEIILKTNNIPIKFDLFISTISHIKKETIEKYIKKYSNANIYEIKIVKNKGRDILPFLDQMKFKIKKYKYFCHIHTKKSKHDTELGLNWRNYLYQNLLGSKDIIYEILTDFENYEKLGFIFPEVYYYIIKDIDNYDSIDFPLHKPNKKYMNFILNQIYPRFQIGNKLIFPTGDMFWSKVNAIYQIFKIRFKKAFPKELNQTNETIMHGIERIWLYLVKLNGYYFKVLFKHY